MGHNGAVTRSDANTSSRRRWIALGAFFLVLVVTGGLALGWNAWRQAPPAVVDQPIASPPTATVTPKAPIVVIVSIDGFNPEGLALLGKASAPHLTQIAQRGASTMNARTSRDSTKTLPNHTGMLTGREINGAHGHGVDFNDDNGSTLAADTGAYVPGIFDVAHDRGLRTAFFAEKDKFTYLLRSWDSVHGAADMTGDDNGADKIDHWNIADAAQIVSEATSLIEAQHTDVIFVHLASADRAGHAHGWLSDAYLTALASVDGSIGTIRTAVDASKRPATLIVTSDHGGPRGNTKHSDNSRLANVRIPFMVYGDAVPAPGDLYELNPERIDPKNRLANGERDRPIRNIDATNTALGILGLVPISGAVSTTWPPIQLR